MYPIRVREIKRFRWVCASNRDAGSGAKRDWINLTVNVDIAAD
jgi:hypothetical protein